MKLATILENIRLAEELKTPMCQDTGIIVFYVKVGASFGSVAGVPEALRRATRRATEEVPLRPNAVHPLTRKNSNDNTGMEIPHIVWEHGEGDTLDITALPKGAGSENMSAFSMLKPSEGETAIKRFAVDTVIKAGGQPCPPIVVGVGVGGTADLSLKLAKKALLRPISDSHPEPEVARLERELLKGLNLTGIGPMGVGGATTALAVKVEYAHCHTASLPVGINLQCWSARRASARVHRTGKVEYARGG
jgi:fumarate hydratase subunit alpha